MAAMLKRFQQDVLDGIVARFANVRMLYRQLADANAAPDRVAQARRADGALVLQAPTGAGKTLIAVEALRQLSRKERVLWFWFAPFAGLVQQSRSVLAAQAPELDLFDFDSDRQLDAVLGGGVFVTTWAAVAARNADSRRARTRGDDGLALDDLIALARDAGLRIGCVVDEAHHGFHKAAQARAFFTSVLAPDYTLMMTATPRDADVAGFERDTGITLGEPADWASVSRYDAVEAGLLKRGVRIVRFIARDGDTAQLVDFEHLALRECAAMHRTIGKALREAGIGLTPLMLVQVPNGRDAQDDARTYLVDTLGFAADAVRVHTADEPDPELLSLADDPRVEVLIFKMAVALGFDAPRAFTLTALRGARDAAFGVQVIGRIVRRHALVQAYPGTLPALLEHGYVFLANAQAQEGLLDAGAQINTLTTQAPELGTQTVVTVIGDRAEVQVARSGEPLALLVSRTDAQVIGPTPERANAAADASTLLAGGERDAWQQAAQAWLGLSGGHAEPDAALPAGASAPLLALARESLYRYPRRADAPTTLRSERLPDAPEDFETQLVDFVDFNDAVLASRLRSRVQVQRSETELFASGGVAEDTADTWADVSPVAVAERATRVRAGLSEANDRELQLRLLDRFTRAIERTGAAVPDDEEILLQQLDLVLVRHPALLREAYRRLRHGQVRDVDVPLLAELHSDTRLESARRALYGVFPPDLDVDERVIADALDASPQVRWWHRNLPHKPESVGLYRWDEGKGFFPDFVVAVEGRTTLHGIVLLEVKGGQWWGEPREVEKSTAVHPDYGPVLMVGRRRGEREFHHLRKLGERLETDGVFSVDRLRHV